MTLKVGGTYTARNGLIVRITRDLPSGNFEGRRDEWSATASPIIYRPNGTTLADGWAEYSIDAMKTYVLDDAPDGRVPDPMQDRLDKLEAQCADLFRQLRDVRQRATSERTWEIASGEAMKRIERLESAETGVNGTRNIVARMAARVNELVDRLDGTDRLVSALCEGRSTHDETLREHATSIHGVRDRVATIESTLARIEDMLTSEKRDGSHSMRFSPPPPGFPDYSKGPLRDLNTGELIEQAYPEVRQPPAMRESLGWFNLYPSGEFVRHGSRVAADADDSYFNTRVACVEIFKGEGL